VRFVIYGAGAIGGVIGGRLFEHGNDVTLIARGSHLDALRARGLTLVTPERETVLPVPAVGGPDAIEWNGDEVVVLAMKTQDTADALAALAVSAPASVAVVCAQNGVENERIALRRFEAVHAVCVMLPATHLEAGVVEQSSTPIAGLLDIGRAPVGVDAIAEGVAGALSEATFESVPRPDVMRWKYAKLLTNLGNAVEALCGHGEVANQISRRARSEGAGVLRAAGIDAASVEEDRERRGDKLQPQPIGGRHRGGGSSWQSLHRGAGRIEADYLNGEICMLGRLNGVPTPVNATLQRLANEFAAARRPPGSLGPEALLALLP
jgi:2-dehydropantoate 2-reductase